MKTVLLLLLCIKIDAQIFVDSSITTPGDGTSWENAYDDLQVALSNSESGTDIWVAQGIYYTSESSDRKVSFVMKEGVSLYGGFQGIETSLSERDIIAYETILSGNIGDKADDSDNSYHVVKNKENGLPPQTKLDGFTISDGNASDPEPYERGGGVFNKAASPSIQNCLIVNNKAQYGAAIYNLAGSSPVIDKCIIINNEASEVGGGISNVLNCSPEITDCVISGNRAIASLSGALYNFISWSTMTNCLITGNSAQVATTCYNTNGSTADFINCTIACNYAGEECAGVFNVTSTASFYNTVVWNNVSELNEAQANFKNTLDSEVYADSRPYCHRGCNRKEFRSIS